MKTLTRSMVRHAHAIAREVGARVIMLYADVVEDDKDLNDLIRPIEVQFDDGVRQIDMSRQKKCAVQAVSRQDATAFIQEAILKVACMINISCDDEDRTPS